MRGLALLAVLGATAGSLAVLGDDPPAPPRFTDDTFADFAAGTLEAGGQNLYVNRDGKVRTIHRFDLNDDGRLDLLFNCTHDTYQMLPATTGSVGKDRATSTADVAIEGSQRVVVGDLDGDGYSEAVFCPNPIGVHGDRRHVSIAWGGPDGWSARRVNGALPVHGAAAVALPDLNADGRPDIAVLCGHRWRPEQPDGQIVRVFWNSPTGSRRSSTATSPSSAAPTSRRATSTSTAPATSPSSAARRRRSCGERRPGPASPRSRTRPR